MLNKSRRSRFCRGNVFSPVKTVIIFPTIVRPGRCIPKGRSFPLSLFLSFSLLHFRFDEICIRGNESQDPEGRQVAMPSQLRVSFVCVHTVKMKWPRALITVQKGLKTGVGNVGPRCIN